LILETFNTETASITSGFENKQNNVLLIGAGAIGSEIAESLARTGTMKLTIIDNDSLRPHNLARHTLAGSDLGEFKAEAIASKLNTMFSSDLCKPIAKDFMNMDSKETDEIIKDVNLIVNASSSLAVQSRLSEIIPAKIPVISCFQINRGHGTVLLFSPDMSIARLDMCEAILITKMKDYPLISRWLNESGDTISIGGGCRSVTSKISGSVVKIGGGWIADRILRYLNNEKIPQEAFIEILEYDYEEDGKIRNLIQKIESSITYNTEDWKIVTNKSVIDKINQMAKDKYPYETGGAMIGRLDRQKKIAFITDAWQAPKDSIETTAGFSRGLAGLKNKIAILEKDTNDYLSYVGEWHSHPPGHDTSLSSVDSPTARRMAKELERDRVPAICLITNSIMLDVHIIK